MPRWPEINGWLVVHCFDAATGLRETIAGVVQGLLTMLIGNISYAWTGGTVMADSSLNWRMMVRLGPIVAFAQVGICGIDGSIELEAVQLYGLPRACTGAALKHAGAAGRDPRIPSPGFLGPA